MVIVNLHQERTFSKIQLHGLPGNHQFNKSMRRKSPLWYGSIVMFKIQNTAKLD